MSESKLDINKYLGLFDELLEATHSLAETHVKTSKKVDFLRVLEAIYRKNYLAMLSIRYLANKTELGDSALVIARGLLEDTIYIEYMVANDKQKMAKKFKKYLWVQLHQSAEFMKELNQNPEEMLNMQIAEIEDEYKKVKDEFIHKPTNKPQRSWTGMNFEQMLINLAKGKKLRKFDISRTLMGYVYGSWKTHLNPYDVISYLDNELRSLGREQARDLAVVFSMTSFIRLTTRYIDEIRFTKNENVYENVAQTVRRIFAIMDR